MGLTPLPENGPGSRLGSGTIRSDHYLSLGVSLASLVSEASAEHRTACPTIPRTSLQSAHAHSARRIAELRA